MDNIKYFKSDLNLFTLIKPGKELVKWLFIGFVNLDQTAFPAFY